MKEKNAMIKKLLIVAVICMVSAISVIFLVSNKYLKHNAKKAEMLPDCSVFSGEIEDITKDGDVISSILLKKDDGQEVILKISEYTACVDNADVRASDINELSVGEYIYADCDLVSTMSIPAQTTAFAVIRNVTEGSSIGQYHVVSSKSIMHRNIISVDNDSLSLVVDNDTSYMPYKIKSIVSASDIKTGSRVLIWKYTNTNAARDIMLLNGDD